MKLTNKLIKKIQKNINATKEQKEFIERYAKIFSDPKKQEIIKIIEKKPISDFDIQLMLTFDNVDDHLNDLLRAGIIYLEHDLYYINTKKQEELKSFLGGLFKK